MQGSPPAPQNAPTRHQVKYPSEEKAAFLGPGQGVSRNGSEIPSPYVETGIWIWTWPSSPVMETWTWSGSRTCAFVSYLQQERETLNRSERKIFSVGEESGSMTGYVCGIDHDHHSLWIWEQNK